MLFINPNIESHSNYFNLDNVEYGTPSMLFINPNIESHSNYFNLFVKQISH